MSKAESAPLPDQITSSSFTLLSYQFPGSVHSSFPHLPSNPATSIAKSTFTICHKSFLVVPCFLSKFKEDFALIFFLL